MSKQTEIGIVRHEWLDCSISWFITINGVRQGGEFYSASSAKESAKSMAESLGTTYTDKESSSNELFS